MNVETPICYYQSLQISKINFQRMRPMVSFILLQVCKQIILATNSARYGETNFHRTLFIKYLIQLLRVFKSKYHREQLKTN